MQMQIRKNGELTRIQLMAFLFKSLHKNLTDILLYAPILYMYSVYLYFQFFLLLLTFNMVRTAMHKSTFSFSSLFLFFSLLFTTTTTDHSLFLPFYYRLLFPDSCIHPFSDNGCHIKFNFKACWGCLLRICLWI